MLCKASGLVISASHVTLSSSRRVEIHSKTRSEVNAWRTVKAQQKIKPQSTTENQESHQGRDNMWGFGNILRDSETTESLDGQITELRILYSGPVERPQGLHRWIEYRTF
jgi:hypothetical protein